MSERQAGSSEWSLPICVGNPIRETICIIINSHSLVNLELLL
jgi:hypothetical protein